MTDQYRGGPPSGRWTDAGSPGPSGHIDTETLSDHAEGLLDPGRDATVRAHLTQCAECTGTLGQLAEVRSVLSSLPPPPIPDDVATRLESTLARAQQERADVTPNQGRAPGQGGRSGWSRLLSFLSARPQALAGAAAVVVAIAVVGGYLGTRGPSDQAGGPSSSPTAQPPSAVQAPIASGQKYSGQDLGKQARQTVREAKKGGYTPGPSASKLIDKEIKRLSDPDELEGCISAITRGNSTQRVVMADLAEFNDQPAAIVVLTVPSDASKYEVAAVGAGCSAGHPHVLSRVTVPKR
ncbi:MAG: zf-HC2 domain-containing protein [Streptosporangiales bacterium]